MLNISDVTNLLATENRILILRNKHKEIIEQILAEHNRYLALERSIIKDLRSSGEDVVLISDGGPMMTNASMYMVTEKEFHERRNRLDDPNRYKEKKSPGVLKIPDECERDEECVTDTYQCPTLTKHLTVIKKEYNAQ